MFDFVHQNAITFENRDTFLRSSTHYFPQNLFIRIHPNEIDELQKIIPIPKQLKRFWLEVGEGFIHCSSNGLNPSECSNQILSPLAVKEILLGEHGQRPFFEVEDNTLPFFEVNPSSFICMKCDDSDTGVYWMHGGKIAHSLQTFFEKLLLNPNDIPWVEP